MTVLHFWGGSFVVFIMQAFMVPSDAKIEERAIYSGPHFRQTLMEFPDVAF